MIMMMTERPDHKVVEWDRNKKMTALLNENNTPGNSISRSEAAHWEKNKRSRKRVSKVWPHIT